MVTLHFAALLLRAQLCGIQKERRLTGIGEERCMDDRGQEKNKIGKVGSLTRVLQIGKCTG